MPSRADHLLDRGPSFPDGISSAWAMKWLLRKETKTVKTDKHLCLWTGGPLLFSFLEKNRLITKTREETEIVSHISSPGDTECGTLKMYSAAFYLHCRMQSSQLPITVLISQMEKHRAQSGEAIFPRTQSKGTHLNISSSILRHSIAILLFF